MTSAFLTTAADLVADADGADARAGAAFDAAAAGLAVGLAVGLAAALATGFAARLAVGLAALAADFVAAVGRVAFGPLDRPVARFGAALDRRRLGPDPAPFDPVGVSSAIAFSSGMSKRPLSTSADPAVHEVPVNASLTLDEMAVDRSR